MLPTVSTLLTFNPHGQAPSLPERTRPRIEVEYVNLNGVDLPVPSRVINKETEIREQSLAKIMNRAKTLSLENV